MHHGAVIRKAYEAIQMGDGSSDSSVSLIAEKLRDIRGSTLSNQEAFLTLQLCLKSGCFQRDLIRDCLSIVEADYFSPVLQDAWNGESPIIIPKAKNAVTNCYDGINAMSIREKASMIVWQERIGPFRNKYAHKSTFDKQRYTTELDPEKRELFTTRKLGKVIDPKPFKVRVHTMAPGKKLCATLAVQLREGIPSASLTDLGHMCTMFSVKRPLSGTMNDDTLDLLSHRLYGFSAEELANHIHQIAIMCFAAAERAAETWSYHRASERRRSSEAHRLYRISRKQLPKRFLIKVAEAAGIYATEKRQASNLTTPILEQAGPLNQYVYTLRSLARSDVPISMDLWDKLMQLVAEHIDDGSLVDSHTVVWLLEAVNASKYTTPITIDVTRRVMTSCKPTKEPIRSSDSLYPIDIARILRLIWTYALTEDTQFSIEAFLGKDQSKLTSFPSHIRDIITQILRDMGWNPTAKVERQGAP
ncbi:P-type ATPase, putative [Babesia ovis]|uniref:P-type ATPase, putative n=1 Tax=Babesia ovis TaxID=5869 RepID=A0A9W5WUL6_BABOV|nr:P-type ATPase, putative [Babesia ovis]